MTPDAVRAAQAMHGERAREEVARLVRLDHVLDREVRRHQPRARLALDFGDHFRRMLRAATLAHKIFIS